MTTVQLLDKTEVWLRGVHLDDADLPEIAKAVACELELPEDKVFITDVREGLVVLDILSPRVELEAVTGKQDNVFDGIRGLSGVSVDTDATVHSEGILGVIGTPRQEVDAYLAGAQRLEGQLIEFASKRVAVVSTGSELVSGEVKDTNFLAIQEAMEPEGFEVVYGGVAGDSEREITGLVARLSSEGFGLVITTGGVGAEDKDKTIEAISLLDKGMSTAVLAKFKEGHGRHVKDSIRIGIAQMGWSTIVSLPGPTHEVKLALPVLIRGIVQETPLPDLIEAMAVPIRATLPKALTQGHEHVHRESTESSD